MDSHPVWEQRATRKEATQAGPSPRQWRLPFCSAFHPPSERCRTLYPVLCYVIIHIKTSKRNNSFIHLCIHSSTYQKLQVPGVSKPEREGECWLLGRGCGEWGVSVYWVQSFVLQDGKSYGDAGMMAAQHYEHI